MFNDQVLIMKTRMFSSLAIVAISTLAVMTGTVVAQDSVAGSSTAAAPALSYGVEPVVELAQAKVSDDIIVRYVQNSGTIFALQAPEIVYLKQQGVSDAVLGAMMDQRERLTGSTEPAVTVPPATITDDSAPAAVIQPVAYVAPAPAPIVYVIPDTQTYRYNREYGNDPYAYSPRYYIRHGMDLADCYPAVSIVHIGTGYGNGYGHGHFRRY